MSVIFPGELQIAAPKGKTVPETVAQLPDAGSCDVLCVGADAAELGITGLECRSAKTVEAVVLHGKTVVGAIVDGAFLRCKVLVDATPEAAAAAMAGALLASDDSCEPSGVDYREEPIARPIVGEVILRPQDLLLRHSWEDTIAVCQGRLSGNGTHPLFYFYEYADAMTQELAIHLPLRALLPVKVDGMIVPVALSMFRDCVTVFDGAENRHAVMNAAGAAAAMAIAKGVTLRRLPVRELQAQLIAAGVLPPEVLDETDGIAPEACPEGLRRCAEVFERPDRTRRQLQARFEFCPDLEDAQLLAFMGDASGRGTLQRALDAVPAESGAVDAIILALAFIGGGTKSVLTKLRQMHYDGNFLRLRAVSKYFLRWTSSEAVPELDRLLRESIAAGGSDRLSAVYIIAALYACRPSNEWARETLGQISRCKAGIFAEFASKYLQFFR